MHSSLPIKTRGFPPRDRRLSALALLFAAAACGEEPSPSAATAEQPSSAAPVVAAPAHPEGVITLVTGDRVTLRKTRGSVLRHIEPGPGREHLAITTQEQDGELSVIPEDMLPLLAAGQIDPALFNVTSLLEEGYGDDQRGDLPLLVTNLQRPASAAVASGGAPRNAQRTPRALRAGLTSAGLAVHRELPGLGALAVRQRKDQGGRALAVLHQAIPGAKLGAAAYAPRLWLDRRLQLSLDHSIPQIGAPAAYARGFAGTGVTVAVLDTGVDATHPDLLGRVVAAETFVDDGAGPGDAVGHGTHVASTIAGSGAASDGQLHGVAPDATLISGRVCDLFGCPVSSILAGMEWAVDHDARIVNLSLGGADSPGVDPLEEAVNTLSAQHGTLFVIAAGNAGANPGSVSSPSSADAALSVGAVDRNDIRAGFSGQGPRTGDHALKPDLTAPGVAIVAARAAGTFMGSPVGDLYTRASGTSMATPHVAGAAALLSQQHPTWTGEQLKAALMSSAQPSEVLTVYQQGAGRLDVDRATRQSITAAPASLSFGVVAYPHDDDQPIVRAVQYRNAGAAAVSLTLSATLTSRGVAAPAEMISVEPSQLTLAAGATAAVTVTIDTRVATADGVYGGALIASSSATGDTGTAERLITPLGVEREVESHDLTIEVRDEHGAPGAAFLSLRGTGGRGTPAGDVRVDFVPVLGQASFRIPVGTYTVNTIDQDFNAWLVAPRVAVATATTLRMDEQLARPFAVTLPEPSVSVRRSLWSYLDQEWGRLNGIITETPLATAEIGASARPGVFHGTVSIVYTADVPAPDDLYVIARLERDHFLSGWTKTLRPRDLATVRSTYRGADDLSFNHLIGPVYPDVQYMETYGFPLLEGRAPRAHHYYGEGLEWASFVDVFSGEDPELVFHASEHVMADYRPGRTYHEVWNQGTFGPGFAGRTFFGPLLSDYSDAPKRVGDYLVLEPSMFSGPQSPTRETISEMETSRLTLLRDGEILDEVTGSFEYGLFTSVAPELAEYRLEAEATRSPERFELSTHVSAAWTFSSQRISDEHIATLPLPTLRFAPPLDEHNRTAARALALPIRIERAQGSPGEPTPRIADARVEVSFDDGATWKRIPILRLGDQAVGLVVHPPAGSATHVSLRGDARDVAGNAVEQSIIRAYALARP